MKDEIFLQRCLDIARLGIGTTSPNPNIGAVLVYQNRVIGEGWTSPYGGAHAEVNALKSVKKQDVSLIKLATLYVSLEPCHHFGKTPPCVDLILSQGIPNVVIACQDPNPLVAGKSITKLLSHGVNVKFGLLKTQAEQALKPFFTNIYKKYPYIILKYAMSQDNYIGKNNTNIWLTNSFSKRLTHRWRNEIDAILVGTKTALIDNPQLNNRLWYGKSPKRVVFDRHLSLPPHLHLFDGTQKTYIVTSKTPPEILEITNIVYIVLAFDAMLLANLLSYLYKEGIGILMVEGGAQTLQQFIDADLWDEARVFIAPKTLHDGIAAPNLPRLNEAKALNLGCDIVKVLLK